MSLDRRSTYAGDFDAHGDSRLKRMDDALAEAAAALLHAAAALNVARTCLRTANAELGVESAARCGEHIVTALKAMKTAGEIYTPGGVTIH